MGRLKWEDLRPGVHRGIQERIGAPVLRYDDQAPQGTADFSAAIHTERGSYFVKAVLQSEHVHARSRSDEMRLNKLLPRTAPRLLWRTSNAEWVITGYEYVNGRPARFEPDSPDVPELVGLLAELAVPVVSGSEHFPSLGARWSIAAPWRTLAHTKPRTVGTWERKRFKDFADQESYVFDVLSGGTCIAHADVHEKTVLVGPGGIRIAGWTWATRAPAWVDAAVFVVRLIAAGHSPQQAEDWVSNIPAWKNAAAEALDAFSVALLGLWTVTSRYPSLVEAARRYAQYRLDAEADQTAQ
ncbi:hypothetical protein QRX60_48905 [Amycolatopsis mongoliensis]|uniref:Aminoglycoside phosphotransferase domain-containing protein n=1 Tax=Amycolatopsis mongoliensis TaxID=715475 RepID=A0A9Y2NDL4_9PSEU|nr:hypothetical protein [Amycolatopsis sp. 4-36]WIY01846.1 hypothetical protein QRX60_48905 [Amycolatopsis sp. 4-36]